eukprot:5193173-Pleurochrysis_carterae.AAC.2
MQSDNSFDSLVGSLSAAEVAGSLAIHCRRHARARVAARAEGRRRPYVPKYPGTYIIVMEHSAAFAFSSSAATTAALVLIFLADTAISSRRNLLVRRRVRYC